MKHLSLAAAAASVLALHPGCQTLGDVAPPGQHGSAQAGLCSKEQLPAVALERAGPSGEGEAILPNGRRVRPAGAIVPLGDMALGLMLHPSGTFAYVVHAESKKKWDGVHVVDIAKAEVVQKVEGVPAFHGIAIDGEGKRLVVAEITTGLLHRFDVGADGLLSDAGTIPVGGSPVDVQLSESGAAAYVLSNTSSRVYEVVLETGAVESKMRGGTNPFRLAVDEGLGRLFTSNLGSGTVTALDLASGEGLENIPVGKNPQGLAIDRQGYRLYVANSDSDTISVIDTKALAVVATWDLTGNEPKLTGGALNALHLDIAGGRIYAAMARRNELSVVSVADGSVLGSVPTGHYPVAVGVTPDRQTLVALSAKGFGSLPKDLDSTAGMLTVLPLPEDEETLAMLTQQSLDNNLRPTTFFPPSCTGENLPPALAGGPNKPIDHVVLIVKENKTYDAVLGDDPTLGDGDPALCMFPEAVTPNTHRLAREFANLENFYSDPERSIQGHLWTSMADCNDYVEKIHQVGFALYGYEDATIVEGGTIFDHCLLHGVSFRNYGEFPGFGHHLMDDFEAFIDHKYPLWTMSVPDVEKAAELIRELEEGIFPQFVYIVLPNDHTYGGKAGAPSPTWMVADNDAGLGMIVDAISRSPYWPETAIFVIQDDPQGPPDHIHSHRSICLVVGPHVRRGYVSGVQYSIASVYSTIERILGLPPLNRNTLEAPPMIDVFLPPGEEPDFTPYDPLPNAVPYAENPAGTEAAFLSAKLDFSAPDRAPGLGLVLWKMLKGGEPIPPYAKHSDE